ncbi:MAG: hypothetical protein H7A46_11695 [Verrucomicrobiales bacterium]|nr:hypothetical protein [Verrucomicrobiales bacterium]
MAEQHARRIVTNAFRCEKFISGLIDNLPTERQNARRQLEGLREKLFVDDWRLAAHYAPSIDASKAEEALASLIDTPGTTEIAAVLDRYSRSAQPAASGDGDSLADHYQRLLEGRNPEYRQVAEVVDAHLSYPGQSAEDDLLKDAAMYVALRTQAIEWWEETSNSLSTSEQSFTGKMKEGAGGVQPEAVAGMGSFFQEAHEGLSQSFESQLGAIDQVFDWRFSEKHGMDGKALIADLGRLSLRGATGSDLSVPAP